MERILIAGLDTIAGGNLAAALKDRLEVSGVCWTTPIAVAGCTTEPVLGDESFQAGQLIQQCRPDWIVWCGSDAQWGWESSVLFSGESSLLRQAKVWAEAAARTDAQFTCLSSSSIFTGPWMFHDEESVQFCASPAARLIRNIELEITSRLSRALIVRTHVFGWSPCGEELGFAARLLQKLRVEEASSIDCVRHASPILGTDLAEVLLQAYKAGLSGICHIGGAERIHPHRFVSMLAEQFGYSCSVAGTLDPVEGRANEFGAGESSLNCRRVRNELQIPLPLVWEGIQRFHEQGIGDFRDQFVEQGRQNRNLVA